MKKLLYLFIAGLLIFSSVDNIFATNYKQMGKVYPQGNFSSDCFTLIYNTTLAANATSVTISNLAGNTTVEYKTTIGWKSAAASCLLTLQLNNDTATNYGAQRLQGSNTAITASREAGTTGIELSRASNDAGEVNLIETSFYAKSGYVRTSINEFSDKIATTTVTRLLLEGQSWNNTSSEITSLVVLANQANGIGAGTYISLWGKEYKQ